MKVDVNSWVGRIAWKENPWIADECSLFRALIWGLFKRGIRNIVLPVFVICALLIDVAIVLETHSFPFPDVADNSVFLPWLMDQYVFPVQVFLGFATAVGTLGASAVIIVVPVLACLFAFVYISSLAAKQFTKMRKRRAERAGASDVITAGVSNWWNKLCRPIEVVNDKIPSWLVNGNAIVLAGVEGIVHELEVAHARGKIQFTFEVPERLQYFHHGFETCKQWEYMDIDDIASRMRPAHEVK